MSEEARPLAPTRLRAAVFAVASAHDEATAPLAELEAFACSAGFFVSIRYKAHPTHVAETCRRMLARARAGTFVAVIVARVHDLAGTTGAALYRAVELHHAGVRVISMTEPGFDPEDPHVRAVAEDERRRRERSEAALVAKRARGERVGAIPFGWRLASDGKRLEPNTDEQLVIARARTMTADGMSTRAIAHALSAEGHRSRGGGRLGHSQVRRMLATVVRSTDVRS